MAVSSCALKPAPQGLAQGTGTWQVRTYRPGRNRGTMLRSWSCSLQARPHAPAQSQAGRLRLHTHVFIPQMFVEQLLCAKDRLEATNQGRHSPSTACQRAAAAPPPSHHTVIVHHTDRQQALSRAHTSQILKEADPSPVTDSPWCWAKLVQMDKEAAEPPISTE